jgi:hypothetical protein
VAAANSAAELAQATGDPAHVHTAALAQQDAQTALVQLDSEGNRAATTVIAADRKASGVFSPDGPLRSTIDKVHTALGFAGADGILWALGKGPEAAREFMSELTGAKSTEADWLEEMLREASASGESWSSVADRWWAKSDAAEAFGQQFVNDTQLMGTVTRLLRMAGAPIAIAGDVSTFLNPPQAGAMGWVDRGTAVVNAGYVGADGLGALGGTLGVEALADLSLGPVGAGIAWAPACTWRVRTRTSIGPGSGTCATMSATASCTWPRMSGTTSFRPESWAGGIDQYEGMCGGNE